MTRRNKHAAWFGDRYRLRGGPSYPPVGFNIRRFEASGAFHSAVTHSGGDVLDIDSSDRTRVWLQRMQAVLRGPVAVEITQTPPDILDRIDDTLLTYDSQRATGDEPWPYGSF